MTSLFLALATMLFQLLALRRLQRVRQRARCPQQESNLRTRFRKRRAAAYWEPELRFLLPGRHRQRLLNGLDRVGLDPRAEWRVSQA
jgi:hypothetical protein